MSSDSKEVVAVGSLESLFRCLEMIYVATKGGSPTPQRSFVLELYVSGDLRQPERIAAISHLDNVNQTSQVPVIHQKVEVQNASVTDAVDALVVAAANRAAEEILQMSKRVEELQRQMDEAARGLAEIKAR